MNHEYVLFSKNTCQNSMVNVLDKDKILWYVMRVYKNENNLEILTSEAGLEELMNKYSKRDEIKLRRGYNEQSKYKR